MHCAVNKCYTEEKKCYACEHGYYFKDNECYVSSSGINENHCQPGYCSPTENGKCFSCEDGYYLNSESKCIKIEVANCIESADGETCIKCKTENMYYSINNVIKWIVKE